ncbi:alanine racemase [Sanguibacter suaedae]|uniref:Alanine racemase n=1 Tax=Sanguibacter suaedae TaxID=2795737 RepID=A0A934I7Z7_9MICO|nr:alanine racemase [Sanguibacter suaedae]MBI9113662.1 alanine racemase [Sanguibacter suaedae]
MTRPATLPAPAPALATGLGRRGPSAPELCVDLDAIAANCRLLAGRVRGDLMAVVKADGFGHGAVAVARTAVASGATWLGVTALSEGLALRDAGLRVPVLSWLNPVGADFGAAVRAGVDLAVPSVPHLAAVAAAAGDARTGPARVHLHLDTGLARDGASPEEWPALCRAARLAELDGRVQVVGVMGHLALADVGGPSANAAGRAAFERGLQVARAVGLRPRHRHLAATAATLTDPATHHTMVRVGAGLVGIDPSDSTSLRPALTLTAPVVSVRQVPAGTGVGYGHAWVASRATTLALLPVGYADGLPRAATGRAEVLLGGRRCPVVGRISMDQVVVDVGPGSPVAPGDTATVVGTGRDAAPTAAEWARWARTLEHEIVTGLGSAPLRVLRRFSPDPTWSPS